MQHLPPYADPKRTPMTDEEVLTFVKTFLQDDLSWSKTKLLRHLRRIEGKACEQKRFGNLFEQARQN